MKAIQKELGELDDAPNELEELRATIDEARHADGSRASKALRELGKLKLMSPMSAEATVVRNYVDWMVACRGRSARRGAATTSAHAEKSSTRTTTASRR